MIRKILVAHGGAEFSNLAFDFGLELAGKFKARLTVLSVVRMATIVDEEEAEAAIESGRARYKTLHQKLAKKAKAAGVALEAHVAIGHPAEQIVDIAQSAGFDLVILGHRPRSALGRWLLGSVSDRVIDHAPCSVTVVKGKGDK